MKYRLVNTHGLININHDRLKFYFLTAVITTLAGCGAKTNPDSPSSIFGEVAPDALTDIPEDSPLYLTCPDDTTIAVSESLTLNASVTPSSSSYSWNWECIFHDSQSSPSIANPQSESPTFTATEEGSYLIKVTVTDSNGHSQSCTFTITVQKQQIPPIAYCPPNITTPPLVELELNGSGEDPDGEVIGYRWELISQPEGSSAEPPTPPDEPVCYFTPDIVGEYIIRFTVIDNGGNTGYCNFTITAISGEGLRIEIFWNPPEDPNDPTDVDLHLLHPDAPHWFHPQLDCFYNNCDSSRSLYLHWDSPSPDDNPRLDIDDVDGYGPENINIKSPVTGHTYRVGVHFFDCEKVGWEDARVYLKIYCGEITTNPIYTVGPFVLHAEVNPECPPYGSLSDCNQFWKVADVMWNGYDCEVNPIGEVVTAWETYTTR